MYNLCVTRLYTVKQDEKKRDTAILIDRAEFVTSRNSIVCPGKILKASTELSQYRARSIGSIFRAEYAYSVH